MISIVMAYYNRKPLLLKTLDFIKRSSIKDYEIIIVDDGSSPEHKLNNIDDIKLIEIESKEKTWVNSCIPFNIGFKEAKGDIIIIQNPECLHFRDIMKHAINIKDNEYITYACYSLPINWDGIIRDKNVTHDGDEGWYNHSIYRPVGYHFCSAITRKNLEELGGFDERFKDGIDYDDNEFLTRVKRKGLNIKIIDNPIVLHQFHYNPGYRPKGKSNKELYQQILKEDKIKVNENTSN